MQRARRETREAAAQSVAESEARLRAVVAALPQGVVLQDTDGKLLSANPAARDLLGLGPEDATPPEAETQATETQAAQPEARPMPDAGIPAPRPIPGPRPAEGIRATPGIRTATAASPTTSTTSTPGTPAVPKSRTSPENQPKQKQPRRRLPLADPSAPAMIALRTGQVQRAASLALPSVDGTRTALSVTSVPLLSDDGTPHAVVSSLTPVTTALPVALPTGTDELFRLTMAHSPIGMALMGLDGRFLRVNRTLCRMLGYRSDELEARTLFELVHPDDLAETSIEIGDMMRGRQASVELERRYLGHGGMVLWGQLSVALVHDEAGRPLHFITQLQDVSEVRKAHELLTHMTLHDPLTTLPNRTLVLDRIQKAVDRIGAGGSSRGAVAVLVCDVDRFSVLNDGMGHEQGDTVLVEIARRITRALRPADTAGRLGSDRFVVVCEDVKDEADAVGLAERLRRAVSVPLAAAGHTVVPSLSIGIAVTTDRELDAQIVLSDADTAAHRAKENGRSRWALADPTMRQRAVERLDIEHSLRTGVDAGELRLHFQPIVDVRTSKIVGREALVRWQHPERGMLPPVDFLTVAEQTGLISEVGRWVAREAARVAAASGPGAGYVAINVSPHQVARPGLAAMVEQSLDDAGLPPERMVIELTESAMLSATPAARSEIARLDDLGVRIVVDDFGTGFSPLSYLRDLPVSGIKVDRSFTAGLGIDPQCDRIVEAITGLGRGLGVDVVVEGVENEAQRLALSSMGCEHAQGYLFGRPTPSFGPPVLDD